MFTCKSETQAQIIYLVTIFPQVSCQRFILTRHIHIVNCSIFGINEKKFLEKKWYNYTRQSFRNYST